MTNSVLTLVELMEATAAALRYNPAADNIPTAVLRTTFNDVEDIARMAGVNNYRPFVEPTNEEQQQKVSEAARKGFTI